MRNLPPGRTARPWLRDRLATAHRGIDVLEEKTHALVQEHRRLAQHVDDTRRAWEARWREADRWFERAAVIGGSQQFELARGALGATADARVAWRSMMGVTYPAQVDVAVPATDDVATLGRSSALTDAAAAYREAVVAGLDHAAATRALELIEAELATSRRRLRALEHRWVPQLEQAAHDVDVALAEAEREDMVRARWAARGRKGDG